MRKTSSTSTLLKKTNSRIDFKSDYNNPNRSHCSTTKIRPNSARIQNQLFTPFDSHTPINNSTTSFPMLLSSSSIPSFHSISHYKPKQSLYNEAIHLKKEVNNLKANIALLRSECRKKDVEILKKEKIIESALTEMKRTTKVNLLSLDKLTYTNSVSLYKKEYKELKTLLSKMKTTNSDLKKQISISKPNNQKYQNEKTKENIIKLVNDYITIQNNNYEITSIINEKNNSLPHEFTSNHSKINEIKNELAMTENKINNLKEDVFELKEVYVKQQNQKKRQKLFQAKITKQNECLLKNKKVKESYIKNKSTYELEINNLKKKKQELVSQNKAVEESMKELNKRNEKIEMMLKKEKFILKKFNYNEVNCIEQPKKESNKILLLRSILNESINNRKQLQNQIDQYVATLQLLGIDLNCSVSDGNNKKTNEIVNDENDKVNENDNNNSKSNNNKEISQQNVNDDNNNNNDNGVKHSQSNNNNDNDNKDEEFNVEVNEQEEQNNDNLENEEQKENDDNENENNNDNENENDNVNKTTGNNQLNLSNKSSSHTPHQEEEQHISNDNNNIDNNKNISSQQQQQEIQMSAEELGEFSYILVKSLEAKKQTALILKQKAIDTLPPNPSSETFISHLETNLLSLLNCSHSESISKLHIWLSSLLLSEGNNIPQTTQLFLDIFTNIKQYNDEDELFLSKKVKKYLLPYTENLKPYLLNPYITFTNFKTFIDTNKIKIKDDYLQYLFYKMKQFDNPEISLYELKTEIIQDIISNTEHDSKMDAESDIVISNEEYFQIITTFVSKLSAYLKEKKTDVKTLLKSCTQTVQEEQTKELFEIVSIENFLDTLKNIGIEIKGDLEIYCLYSRYKISDDFEVISVDLLEKELKMFEQTQGGSNQQQEVIKEKVEEIVEEENDSNITV